MSIGNGAPAWPSVIVSNGRISRSEHIWYAASPFVARTSTFVTTYTDVRRVTFCSPSTRFTRRHEHARAAGQAVGSLADAARRSAHDLARRVPWSSHTGA